MKPEYSLRWLLQWAHREYVAETPALGHSVNVLDDGGAPRMQAAARQYLALIKEGRSRDNWEEIACRVDKDGRHVTPLRCALMSIRDDWLRTFLRHLVQNAMLRPSDITELHGIPKAAEVVVMHWALGILKDRHDAVIRTEYRKVNWVDQSDSQRNAVIAGEVAPVA